MYRGSVRELEERNEYERQEIMRALFENLTEKGVKCELRQVPAVNCLGEKVQEPVVQLEGHNLDSIRLVGGDETECGVPGDIFRFQYLIKPERKFNYTEWPELLAITRVIREGQEKDYLGGKVVGLKWAGQKLAEELNADQAVMDDLMRCVKSWSYLEFQIEAIAPDQASILGPRFSNPAMIAELYHSEYKEEVQCCAFGYTTVDRIAGHLKQSS